MSTSLCGPWDSSTVFRTSVPCMSLTFWPIRDFARLPFTNRREQPHTRGRAPRDTRRTRPSPGCRRDVHFLEPHSAPCRRPARQGPETGAAAGMNYLAPGGCDRGGCIYNLLGGLADLGVALLVGVGQSECRGGLHDSRWRAAFVMAGHPVSSTTLPADGAGRPTPIPAAGTFWRRLADAYR